MNNAVIKKSTLRSLVRTLLEDKALGPAMINVNPVVDPSAPLVDPSNTDFVPTNSSELKAAVSAMVTGLPDESVPDVYDSIKQALEAAQEDVDMKDEDSKIEEALRRTVRKLIKEALPVRPPPKFMPPSMSLGAPGEDPETRAKIKDLLSKSNAEMSPADRVKNLADYFRTKDKKLTMPAAKEKAVMALQSGTREADKAAAASFIAAAKQAELDAAAGIPNTAQKINKLPAQQAPAPSAVVRSTNPGSLAYSGSDTGPESDEDQNLPKGRKNVMGDKTFEEIADELRAAGESGTSIANIKKSEIIGMQKMRSSLDQDDVADAEVLSDKTVDRIAARVAVANMRDDLVKNTIASAAAANNLPAGSPERKQARIDFVQSIADVMNDLLDTTFSYRDVNKKMSDDDELENLLLAINATSAVGSVKTLLNDFILDAVVNISIRA